MTALTDLHCHILPGLDDGPKDWAATWDMVEMAVGSHVGGIVCTPHCRLGDPRLLERSQRIGELAEVLNRALAKRQVPLRVFPGAELLWEGNRHDLSVLRELTLAGTRYLLVEFPFGERLSRMEYAARCVEDAGFLESPRLPGRMVWQRLDSSARQRERAGRFRRLCLSYSLLDFGTWACPCGFQRRPQWGEPYAKLSAAGEISEGTLFRGICRTAAAKKPREDCEGHCCGEMMV